MFQKEREIAPKHPSSHDAKVEVYERVGIDIDDCLLMHQEDNSYLNIELVTMMALAYREGKTIHLMTNRSEVSVFEETIKAFLQQHQPIWRSTVRLLNELSQKISPDFLAHLKQNSFFKYTVFIQEYNRCNEESQVDATLTHILKYEEKTIEYLSERYHSSLCWDAQYKPILAKAIQDKLGLDKNKDKALIDSLSELLNHLLTQNNECSIFDAMKNIEKNSNLLEVYAEEQRFQKKLKDVLPEIFAELYKTIFEIDARQKFPAALDSYDAIVRFAADTEALQRTNVPMHDGKVIKDKRGMVIYVGGNCPVIDDNMKYVISDLLKAGLPCVHMNPKNPIPCVNQFAEMVLSPKNLENYYKAVSPEEASVAMEI